MRVLIRSSPWTGREKCTLLSAGFLLVATVFSGTFVSGSYSRWKQVRLASSARSNTSLEMRIEMQEDGILLSWNRYMPVLRSAKRGVLQIDDGAQEHRTELDPEQLTNGSIFYSPSKAQVDFRLTVYGADGSTITDHLRVPGRPKPMAISTAPLKPPAYSNTQERAYASPTKPEPAGPDGKR
jgi:hypothetical protein